ncbi:MAG: aminoglycoside phosphotransferase family protein [Actinomycetota bacterium]|nr:aminoglycoside phosphotransferase family protein [Actinomycetota bacterium]
MPAPVSLPQLTSGPAAVIVDLVMFIDIPLTAEIRTALADEWGYAGHSQRLYGGEESAAYRVGSVVVRIGSMSRDLAEVEWCNEVAAAAARRVPEVIAPSALADGTTALLIGDRPITVWPYVAGSWADRHDPQQRAESARLLARLHLALVDERPRARPRPSLWQRGLDGSPQPDLPDRSLDRWLAEFSRDARVQPLHGDFYARNLLAIDGHVVAVLDWDEALIGPAEMELASAAWEFSKSDADLAVAHGFVDDYREAGGPARALDDATLKQLIRHRLRCESVAFAAAERRRVHHDSDDVDYQQVRVAAFHRLRP